MHSLKPLKPFICALMLACSGQPADSATFAHPPTEDAPKTVQKAATWGQPITLKVKESRTFETGLFIKLKSITDSTCPPDMDCVWAGDPFTANVIVNDQKKYLKNPEIMLCKSCPPVVERAGYQFTFIEVNKTQLTFKVDRMSE